MERFWTKTTPSPDGCLLWTASKFKTGYGQFFLDGQMRYAHRVAWMIANGPVPKGMLVCHTCDVRTCVNSDHLFLGTNADNARDKERKGRANHTYGEAHAIPKLNTHQVIEIRSSPLSQRKLATKYGVAKGVIQNILNGTKWAKV